MRITSLRLDSDIDSFGYTDIDRYIRYSTSFFILYEKKIPSNVVY